MWPLLKDSFHDFMYNKDFARTRLRTLISALGAILGGLIATNQLQNYFPAEWGAWIIGITNVIAFGLGQGEKNKGSINNTSVTNA